MATRSEQLNWQEIHLSEDEASAQGTHAVRFLVQQVEKAQNNSLLRPMFNNLMRAHGLQLLNYEPPTQDPSFQEASNEGNAREERGAHSQDDASSGRSRSPSRKIRRPLEREDNSLRYEVQESRSKRRRSPSREVSSSPSLRGQKREREHHARRRYKPKWTPSLSSSPSKRSSFSSSSSCDGYSSKSHHKRRRLDTHRTWKRSRKLQKFKEGGKSITFQTYDGSYGATDKVLSFIQQYCAGLTEDIRAYVNDQKPRTIVEVIHRSKKHLMADHLSRITNGEAPIGVDDDLPDTSLFMVETIPEWSEKIVNFLVNGFPPKELRKDVARRLIKECEPYSLIAGTLYKLGKDDILRRCAREDEYLYILQEAHMGVAGGHFSGPISHAACNTQSRYIIVATDYVTKWAEAKASRKADAITTAKFLFENIIARFGCPFEIVSDNGTHFINEVIKELTSNFMISHHKSTPYYPQANGQAESTNKTLISVLTKTVEAHRTDWDLKLTSALWAYQTAYKVAINCTPFKMVYGQEAVMPWEFVILSLRVTSQEGWDGNPLVERLYILERLEEERQLAVYNALIEKDRRKKWFDRHLKNKDIKVGDKVLMYGVRNEKKKLKYAGKGPYRVCKITPQGTICVETLDGIETVGFLNGSKFKRYYDPLSQEELQEMHKKKETKKQAELKKIQAQIEARERQECIKRQREANFGIAHALQVETDDNSIECDPPLRYPIELNNPYGIAWS
ncbi:hypothetical protein L7F22_017380 [Adiantum nelumboides]|nr:hypothetical protein [Adiantum nelumboides]